MSADEHVRVTAAELSCVINWLEGGRDPKDAAKELRLYCERAWTGAQPVQQPAPVAEPHYEAGRRQGRAEALAILMTIEPECGIGDYIGWGNSGAPEDEGSAYWDEPKLRKLLSVDGSLADMMDKAEVEYWKYLGMQDEAERAKNFAANMHNSGKVREVLSKAGEFDLMGRLCSDAPVAAPVAMPNQKLYRFDVLDRRGTVLAEGIGVHAVGMQEAETKARKMMKPGENNLRFKSNSPCHPARKCAICAPIPAASVQPIVSNGPYTFPIGENGEYEIRDSTGRKVGEVLYYGDAWFINNALRRPEQQPDSGRDAALEEVATWYKDHGWVLDEDDVPAAIRALAAHPANVAQPVSDAGITASALENEISNAIFGCGEMLEDHNGAVYEIAKAVQAILAAAKK